jgi:hypothetical protein
LSDRIGSGLERCRQVDKFPLRSKHSLGRGRDDTIVNFRDRKLSIYKNMICPRR